ncbi:MAG: glycosyltransferase [Sphingomonadales bacterium]|nr:glycosyltransferase [Sphingomonadales bacterium]
MKASIVIVTYNHANFIDKALKSVLDQKADFPFEVIISEDASTDGTRDIVRGWQERYPQTIRLLLSEKNVRSNRVIARGFEAAKGDYVALLDGDDFWTSPDKLARQVAVLDADPSLSLCFTNAQVVDAAGKPTAQLWTPATTPARLTLPDLWLGNPFPTCGSLFRRSCVPTIPAWYDGFFPVTDWPLYILFAEHGDIAFLNEPMGAYRLHPGGLYSSQADDQKLAAMDGLYCKLEQCLDPRHLDGLRNGHRRYFLDWAREHLRLGNSSLARMSLERARGSGAGWSSGDGIEVAVLSARMLLRSAMRPGVRH